MMSRTTRLTCEEEEEEEEGGRVLQLMSHLENRLHG